MRILITGGAGFIGSHLTDRLVADGHQITILDNLATGRKENLSAHLGGASVTFIEGSILDLPLLDGLVKETEKKKKNLNITERKIKSQPKVYEEELPVTLPPPKPTGKKVLNYTSNR